ncbi:hypothetical protein [Spongiimicrobium salis]|uniref:hypothetical protein n=1 Tax=Spongiimicrobium salis TaxID=1667022 RepID=UPI00374DE02E
MKSKLSLIILLIFTFFCCKGQQELPKDLDLEGLKGLPKRIVETSEIKPSNRLIKEIYYFNKQGFLTKMEHYNVYHKDEDSLSLGDITFYTNPVKNSRFSITVRNQSNDTIRLKDYNLINDSLININIIEYKNSFNTKVSQKLNRENRIIKTTTKITDTLNKVVKANSETEFIYIEGELNELIITNDKTNENSKSVMIKNEKKDEFGNFVYRELIDENETIVYIVKREYIYH